MSKYIGKLHSFDRIKEELEKIKPEWTPSLVSYLYCNEGKEIELDRDGKSYYTEDKHIPSPCFEWIAFKEKRFTLKCVKAIDGYTEGKLYDVSEKVNRWDDKNNKYNTVAYRIYNDNGIFDYVSVKFGYFEEV